MNKQKIEEFENTDIFKRMDIHDNLAITKDVKVIQSYFDTFEGENAIIGQALVMNPNTPTKIVLELMKNEKYRQRGLSNPNTPNDVLKPYAVIQGEGTWKDKAYVLANPNISDELLDILSADPLGRIFWEARKLRDERKSA